MAPGVSRRATRARTIRARAPARCGARGVHRPTEPSRASRRARARRNWSRRAIRRRGVRLRRENNEKTEGRARIDRSTRGPAASRENEKRTRGRCPSFHRRSPGFIGGAPVSSEEPRFHRRSRTRASVESTAGPERPGPIETGRWGRCRPVVQKTRRHQVARSSGTRERFLPPSLPRVSHHILVLVSSTIFPRSSTLNSSRILTFMRSIEKTCVITHVPSFSPDRRGPSLLTLGA